jgi:hypothetical protein
MAMPSRLRGLRAAFGMAGACAAIDRASGGAVDCDVFDVTGKVTSSAMTGATLRGTSDEGNWTNDLSCPAG